MSQKKTWNFSRPDFLDSHPWFKKIIYYAAYCPANGWTLSRILSVGLIIFLYWRYPLGAAILFVFSLTISDWIDGLVARAIRYYNWTHTIWHLDIFYLWYRLGLISKQKMQKSGNWFDPVADKIFVGLTFYYFGLHLFPLIRGSLFWSLAAIEIVGFAIVGALAYFWQWPIATKASYVGKMKYILECVAGMLLLACYVYRGDLNNFVVVFILVSYLNFFFALVLPFSLVSVFSHIFPKFFRKWHLHPD